MDQLFAPAFWKSQLDVITSAPWLVVPLLVFVGVCVWWARGKIEQGRIEGLKEQLAVREERLVLAQEKERTVKANLEVALSQASAAERNVGLVVDEAHPNLGTVKSSIGSTIAAIKQANTSSDELSSALSKNWEWFPSELPMKTKFEVHVTKRSDE